MYLKPLLLGYYDFCLPDSDLWGEKKTVEVDAETNYRRSYFYTKCIPVWGEAEESVVSAD